MVYQGKVMIQIIATVYLSVTSKFETLIQLKEL